MRLVANDLPAAEAVLRPYLKRTADRCRRDPHDGRAGRARRPAGGLRENLLRRALELAPGFTAARANLATVLYKQNRPPRRSPSWSRSSARARRSGHSSLKAAALGRIGGHDEALATYRKLLEPARRQAKLWMSYGHILKTVGEQATASPPTATRSSSSPRWARPGGAWPTSRPSGSTMPTSPRWKPRLKRRGPEPRGPLPPPFRARQGA